LSAKKRSSDFLCYPRSEEQPLECALHDEAAVLEVHVRPVQPRHLAKAHQLTRAVRPLVSCTCHMFYGVHTHGPTGGHIIVEHRVAGRISCTALSRGGHYPCSHLGAALDAIRQRGATSAHPDTGSLASWRRGVTW